MRFVNSHTVPQGVQVGRFLIEAETEVVPSLPNSFVPLSGSMGELHDLRAVRRRRDDMVIERSCEEYLEALGAFYPGSCIDHLLTRLEKLQLGV